MRRWINNNRGFVAFLLLFGVFRTAVADWNPIPSGSMRPGLLEGDVVLVNRLAYDLKLPLTDVSVARLGEPQRGEVITFFSPQGRTRTIKRVIGIPGDVVQMEKEHLVVNGQRASYALLGTANEAIAQGLQVDVLRYEEAVGTQRRQVQIMPQVRARDSFGPWRVPPGQLLVLGDNRDNSADSRYFGLVPREQVIGRAERVLVSADILSNWMPRTERFGMPLGAR